MSTRCHIVEPQHGQQHTHTVIFLHGRDSINTEFAQEIFESEASGPQEQPRTLPALLPTIRWVFPAAPVLRSARFDTDLSQWFDMWSVEEPDVRGRELQLTGLRASVRSLVEVLRTEEERLPRDKIFLAGISQGFAVVIATLFVADLGTRPGLAGVVGLSSWMPLGSMLGAEDGKEKLAELYRGPSDGESAATDLDGADDDEDDNHDGRKPTPIFVCHSADDEVVPIQNGRALRDILSRFPEDVKVEWHEYEDGGHWLNEPQGVDDMIGFIRRHM